MYTVIQRVPHVKHYPVMLNLVKKKKIKKFKRFTDAQSMFGRGVFTMNRQEGNNFLFATEINFFVKNRMAFRSYFTSRCVKKPAEGTQDFKKTWQIEILERKSILAATLKTAVCVKSFNRTIRQDEWSQSCLLVCAGSGLSSAL